MKPICHSPRHLVLFSIFVALAFVPARALPAELESKPDDPALALFEPLKAPTHYPLLLRAGDRLAICGDSITEQRMYSRIMETYLTVCVPEFKVTTRQFGWSGEVAEGFLRRMTNDCLRFHPTIATTCYGMNDHRYRPYDAATAAWYCSNQTAIVEAFKAAGTRVVLGSPGCIGKLPPWVKTASGTVEELNLNLCALRNDDLEIAAREGVAFADVFWPMLTAGVKAQHEFGPDFGIAGKDGVHPDWAGHLLMARAFLKAMGLDGNLGAITVNLATGQANVTGGHEVTRFQNQELTLTSHRYPFCASGPTNQDNSLRAGMALVPFNAELNRLTLTVTGGTAASYRVTWGDHSRVYSAAQLAQGVNLAADFSDNPFSNAFAAVDAAVAAKQAYETRQIKMLFHGEEGRADADTTAALTEKARQPLEAAITAAFVPVTHTLRLEAL